MFDAPRWSCAVVDAAKAHSKRMRKQGRIAASNFYVRVSVRAVAPWTPEGDRRETSLFQTTAPAGGDNWRRQRRIGRGCRSPRRLYPAGGKNLATAECHH